VRQLAIKDPMMEGEDIKAVQRKLGMRGKAVDGVYGPDTAAKVEEWKWRSGFRRITTNLGLLGQSWLFGDADLPADFKRRAEKRKGQPFAKKGVVRPLATDTTSQSEFRVVDREGARANDGRRFHAGKDWFAPGGSPVRAPVRGKIVEAEWSNDVTGQVFGGEVKIQAADGKVWVFRHVVPRRVRLGQTVNAGQVVANVSRWRDGPPHAHIELWKTLEGGYDFENMIDPMRFL
jgi:murein DD-endopeptidase MepM/ murein hydrolase activator NlpD